MLLDHQMVPTSADVTGWMRAATERGAHAIRTGALFSDSVPPFLDAGFSVIDTLALLSIDLISVAEPRRAPGSSVRIRRLRPSMLDDAAGVDRSAFSDPWANDRATLRDIMSATPHHRSRCIHVGGRMVAFSISGCSDHGGYVQRLAVDPSARRQGFARLLLADSLAWMRRRHVEHAMVNTASNNAAALDLYATAGFTVEPSSLVILERDLR